MHSILADIRFALRQLGKSPGFAATAILTLALGIGATTAIFTLVYQVMLRSLPVSHPEQLYRFGKTIECCVDGGLRNDWSIFSYDLYKYLRNQTTGTASIAAVEAGQTLVSARRAGSAVAVQPLAARFVSGNYFPVLGVSPYAGRLLRPEDDREGAPPAAVLSYQLWRTKFDADPHFVGSTLLLTGHPYTVVGITAVNFLGERNEPDPAGLWVSLAQEPVLNPERMLLRLPGAEWLDLLARVPDVRQIPILQQALAGELRQWIGSHRAAVDPLMVDQAIARQTTTLVHAPDGINYLGESSGSSLKLLQLVATFVLLIACANLANLLLVRGIARKQELAVRVALGAPRLRLLRQTLIEAILLSLTGGMAALVVAYGGSRAILALTFKSTDFVPIDPAPSAPILAFAFATALLTGILFGIAPAWLGSRSNPVEALRGANRSTHDRTARPQKALVILQAALSLVMLSTAGLLITSLRHLKQQDFRFDPQGRLFLTLDLQGSGYSYQRLAALYGRIDDTFARLPCIDHFAYATYGPMAGNNWDTGIWFPGVSSAAREGASYTAVSAHYFETIGTRIMTGRALGEQDTATSAHVAVVNQAFSDKYLKGKQRIGEHFGPASQIPAEFTIVGVADNTKYGDPAEPVPPMFFTPITQTTAYPDPQNVTVERFKHFAGNFIVHYRGDPAAASTQVRRAIAEIDSNIAILNLTTYADQVNGNFVEAQLVVRLTTLFGILALILASIGLYGVTAYSVARRTSEIGIRMALGASRGGVLAMIVKGALTQALLGLALGLPLCFVAGRLLQHTLYQTSGFQPFVLLAVAALLLLSAFIAAIIPARRAAFIDPMQALRAE